MASGGPADPQSWNRYAYQENDPVNWVDPSGLFIVAPPPPPPPLTEPVACVVNGIETNNPVLCTLAGVVVGSSNATPWDSGREKAYEAAFFWRDKRNWSDQCKKTLGDAGVSPKTVGSWEIDAVSRIQLAAATVGIEDGTYSRTLVRDLYANNPALARAVSQTDTVADVFAASGGTSAMTSMAQGIVYIRPEHFNSYGSGYLAAMMLHEVLHNVTGLTDPDLQRNLGLSEDGGSRNVTLRLMQDCLL